MEYKVVPFVASIDANKGNSDHVAQQLESLITNYANSSDIDHPIPIQNDHLIAEQNNHLHFSLKSTFFQLLISIEIYLNISLCLSFFFHRFVKVMVNE